MSKDQVGRTTQLTDSRDPLRPVKPERTGWRDMELSLRHKRWGWDCPAVDLDFLFLEYDKGKAVAVVEYKHEFSKPQFATHPSYQAMIDLGNRAHIPVFACRYAKDFSIWQAVPLNSFAKKYIISKTKMTERQWVALLYRIRGYNVPKSLFDNQGVLI